MERHIDGELRELKQALTAMGGSVERAIEEATLALSLRDPSRLEKVHEFEVGINQSHIEVDERCVAIMARQSPLAADLRLIIAMIKINSDLERMGDQAVNIAGNCKRYLNDPPIKPLIDLPKMADSVRVMVRLALDAFVKGDCIQARQVLDMDDSVDDFKDEIFRELVEMMKKDSAIVEQALNLILIARNLERLGDHATNIAEDVIYAMTGKDIRHGHSKIEEDDGERKNPSR